MQLDALFVTLISQVAVVSASIVSFPQQNPLEAATAAAQCNCTGIEGTGPKQFHYVCNNATLGPELLPWRLPMLSLVSDYDRFGGLSPAAFLAKWWIPASGATWATWRYPPLDGFQLDVDGNPIKGNMTLRQGFKVDRFGAETGRFVSAADAPFAQRALPPDALDVCEYAATSCSPKDTPWSYHVYEVAQDFAVIGGPIAAGFEQPGGGAQYYLGQRVSEWIAAGFLTPLNLSALSPGPGEPGSCGQKPEKCACQRPKVM